jgi:hypothetical protein
MFGIPQSTPQTYLTLSLRQLGFNTFTSNLLTIPSTVSDIFLEVPLSSQPVLCFPGNWDFHDAFYYPHFRSYLRTCYSFDDGGFVDFAFHRRYLCTAKGR